MRIEVLRAGPLASVQDLGRAGLMRQGVCQAGAMDPVALRIANILLGNPETAAGIEITGTAFALRFHGACSFALTGADAMARLEGREVPPCWAMTARAGEVLTLSSPATGLRSYLAVAGGIAVEPVLGSRSTDLKSGFGGVDGRGLRAGDMLPVGQGGACLGREGGFGVALPADLRAGGPADVTTLRVLPAAELDWLDTAAQAEFWSADWRVAPESNRMGLRLAGPHLAPRQPRELLSHGIMPGVVQLPPGGQPIIQVCEANTCGGYPKLGVVIGPDAWRLGQARIGGAIRFVRVAEAEVAGLAALQAAALAEIRRAAALAHAIDEGHRQGLRA